MGVAERSQVLRRRSSTGSRRIEFHDSSNSSWGVVGFAVGNVEILLSQNYVTYATGGIVSFAKEKSDLISNNVNVPT